MWGQRSPGGQVRFEVSVMLFGGQPEAPANSQKGKLRPASTGKGGLPCAGEARASGAGAGSWGQARVLGVEVVELRGAMVISTWECPGGRRLAWRPSGGPTQGLEPGQGGLLGRVVLQTLLVGGPSGPRSVGSSWGLGHVRERPSRRSEVRSLPWQVSCPRETPPPHPAGWLEAQWEGGAHMDILQKHQASLGPGGWGQVTGHVGPQTGTVPRVLVHH